MNDIAVGTEVRQKVFTMENLMQQYPTIDLDEYNTLKPDGIYRVDLKLIHHFSKGVYARELHIPAGVILTGEIHKFENLNILSKGCIEVLTQNGMQRVEAPFTIVSPAGTKRIARAITDCVWTTILGTSENNLEIIEKTFIAKSEQEWLEFCNANQLEFKL